MKLYSDYPARRTAQIIADVIAFGFIALFVWIGTLVYAAIAVLAVFGRSIEDAGNGFEETMADAGETLGGVPFIGAASGHRSMPRRVPERCSPTPAGRSRIS